jgi:hypothetical protein
MIFQTKLEAKRKGGEEFFPHPVHYHLSAYSIGSSFWLDPAVFYYNLSINALDF